MPSGAYYLRNLGLLEGLPEGACRLLEQQWRVHHYGRRETIVEQGAPADQVPSCRGLGGVGAAGAGEGDDPGGAVSRRVHYGPRGGCDSWSPCVLGRWMSAPCARSVKRELEAIIQMCPHAGLAPPHLVEPEHGAGLLAHSIARLLRGDR